MKITRCLAAACVFAVLMTVPVWAAATKGDQKSEQLTPRNAEKMAEKLVPSQSEMIKSEQEDGIYSLRYYNKNYQEWYIVKINKAASKVVSFDSSRTSCQGGKEVIVTEDQVQKKVTQEIPDVSLDSCELQEDEGLYTYVVDFSTQTYFGTYTINAESASILTRSVTVGNTPIYSSAAAAPVASTQEASTAAASIYIGVEKARKLALAKVPGADVEECQFTNEDGRAVYNGVMHKGCFTYDFSVDAITGTMVRWDITNAE